MAKKNRIIAVSNQKGGVGKSTSVVSLAACLAERGRKVLVIDIDPQGNSGAWFNIYQGGDGRGLYDALVNGGDIEGLIRPAQKGIDVIPASPWLSGIDKALANEPGAEGVLKEALEPIRRKYDYILIDTPPNLGMLTLSALVAAREVVVPIEPHAAALAGLSHLLQTIETVKARINKRLKLSGIILCKVFKRARHTQEVIALIEAQHPGAILGQPIPLSVRFPEAWSFQQPITQYDSNNPGAAAYRAVATDIIKQEGK